MNFIEAAIKLLKESRKTMSAEELAELAVERKLLSRPGKNPVRSMKTQLSTEANKDDDSRIVRVGEDRWKLQKSAAESKAKTERTAKTAKAATKKTAKKTAKKASAKAGKAAKPAARKAAEKPAEKAEKAAPAAKKKAAKKATEKKATPKKAAKAAKAAKKATEKAEKAAQTPALETEPAEKAAKKPGRSAAKAKKAGQAEPAARKAGKRGKAAQAEQKSPAAEAAAPAASGDEPRAGAQTAFEEVTGAPSPELAEVLAPKQQVRRVTPAETPNEDAIEEIYGDELTGTEPGAAFAEYRDAQTEDEDRPMVPEMVSSRRDRYRRERRRRSEQRRTRREQRSAQREASNKEAPQAKEAKAEAKPETKREAKPETRREAKPETKRGRGQRKAAAVEAAPPAPVEEAPAAPQVAPAALDFYRPGNILADAAVEVLNSFTNGQPVHAEQLARMMRKRQLITDEPAQVWPHLKAALLNDEQRFRDRGLRPRVIYQGRDMFAPGPVAPSAALADAELALSEAVDGLAAAVHATLKARLSTLDASALERLAHVYLLRSGWRNVQWIKRVERSSYAVGEPPGGMGSVLVGVRAGDQPVDRRGVGELRAGVAYKNLDSGLLLAPQDLSEIARKELSRGGRSVATLVGDAFVAALIRSGVGVLAKQVPVLYFDSNYFDELEEAR